MIALDTRITSLLVFASVVLFPTGGHGYNFLFFHAPSPMSHAKVLHSVTREVENMRKAKSNQYNSLKSIYLVSWHLKFDGQTFQLQDGGFKKRLMCHVKLCD
jgi:hypothetical protein